MKNWNAILIPLAALLVGACGGVYAYDAFLRARIRQYRGEDVPRKISEKMAETLELDDAQREAVYGVFREFGGRFETQREANRAAVDAIRDEMEAELEKHLTPEQTEKHLRFMEENRAKAAKKRELRRAMGAKPPS
jgi:hypothetical protein